VWDNTYFENAYLLTGIVFIAMLGAMVEWLHAKIPRTYTLLFVKLATSMFIGVIFYHLHRDGLLPNGISHVCSGVGGYMGIATIELIKQWLVKRFELEELPKEKSIADYSIEELKTEIIRKESLNL